MKVDRFLSLALLQRTVLTDLPEKQQMGIAWMFTTTAVRPMQESIVSADAFRIVFLSLAVRTLRSTMAAVQRTWWRRQKRFLWDSPAVSPGSR